MSAPFLAEIRIFGFNFAPRGWAFCDGAIVPIQQNVAVFSLVGTTYGGDGKSNFALPNLQGRAALHWGTGTGLSPYEIGDAGGAATVPLTGDNVPAHQHTAFAAAGAAGATSPTNNSWAGGTGRTPPPQFQSSVPNVLMQPTGITGQGQPHNNLQPYLAMNFCIALQGIFPPRS